MTSRNRVNMTATIDRELLEKLKKHHKQLQQERGDERYKFSHYIEDILKGKIKPP